MIVSLYRISKNLLEYHWEAYLSDKNLIQKIKSHFYFMDLQELEKQ